MEKLDIFFQNKHYGFTFCRSSSGKPEIEFEAKIRAALEKYGMSVVKNGEVLFDVILLNNVQNEAEENKRDLLLFSKIGKTTKEYRYSYEKAQYAAYQAKDGQIVVLLANGHPIQKFAKIEGEIYKRVNFDPRLPMCGTCHESLKRALNTVIFNEGLTIADLMKPVWFKAHS